MRVPDKLAELIENLSLADDLTDRAEFLISYADQYREVPPEIAKRPFPEKNKIPYCESEAYIWSVLRDDGTVKLYFAVENPSGISAKALAAILEKTLSGLTAREIAEIPDEIVYKIFRQNISMGKGMGLMAMVQAVRSLARNHLSSL
ncbi:MAG: SufE family protein [Calditrichaceae bacterium]